MKDLITVFAYCPDDNRKKILNELLEKLQPFRERFDLLVVSHSRISEMSHDLLDYFYYDSNNKLLHDFDLRKKHWFSNHIFDINTTFVYPPSTHLAIYSLLYYTFNFAKFKNYKKVHCIEYDINLSEPILIDEVNKSLNDFDNVMFKREDGWVYGTYFAFTMSNFPEEYFIYDEKKILDTLRKTETKMTEAITDKLLTVNNRSINFEPISKLDPTGIFQKVDNHYNNELTFCVPLCDRHSDRLYVFVYNEKGYNCDVDVIVNNAHLNIKTSEPRTWSLRYLGEINEVESITILVNKQIKKQIFLNSENREDFRKYNFIEDHDKKK